MKSIVLLDLNCEARGPQKHQLFYWPLCGKQSTFLDQFFCVATPIRSVSVEGHQGDTLGQDTWEQQLVSGFFYPVQTFEASKQIMAGSLANKKYIANPPISSQAGSIVGKDLYLQAVFPVAANLPGTFLT